MIIKGDIKQACGKHLAKGCKHHNIYHKEDKDCLRKGTKDNHKQTIRVFRQDNNKIAELRDIRLLPRKNNPKKE